MSDEVFTLTHHSLAVEPWKELPGGVRIGDWGDVDPETGEPAPMLLLRDRAEVSRLMTALQGALAESERRGPARGLIYKSALR